MSRKARKKSNSGMYHVMLRGINRQNIFEDEEDREKLFETLKHYQAVSGCKIYAYCFMNNHVHLLIKEIKEPLSLVIKRICGSYVYYFNWKYERVGHLFQDRFKSEPVEDDGYFVSVIRYIHQNPVKAGLVGSIGDYAWSSYREYIGKAKITDTSICKDLFDGDEAKFVEYMNEKNNDGCLEIETKGIVKDKEVLEYLRERGIRNISELQRTDKEKRNEILRSIKRMDGVTIRQLSRVTGISKSVIDRT